MRNRNRTNWTARDQGREEQQNMIADILRESKVKLTPQTRGADTMHRKDVIYR